MKDPNLSTNRLAITNSSNAIFAHQRGWIKAGNTGCKFSQALVTRVEKGTTPWNSVVEFSTADQMVLTEKGLSFLTKVKCSIAEGRDELFSGIFPHIRDATDLARLIAYLGSLQPFHIPQVDTAMITETDPKTYAGIYLRIALPGDCEAWPVVLGPYDFFSPSRRAPYTELVFRPLPEKHNPRTSVHQIGTDDTYLDIPETTIERMYEVSEKDVRRTRAGYNQKLFRARIGVVIPQQEWEKAQEEIREYSL